MAYNPKFGKKAQCGKRFKGNRASVKNGKLVCTESQIQGQADDHIIAKRIKFLRIADFVWKWLKQNAPMHIVKALADRFAGMPDSVLIERVSEKYNLVLQLEIKTEKGELSPKQVDWADETAVVISRSPDETIKEVDEFLEMVERVKKMMAKEKGGQVE